MNALASTKPRSRAAQNFMFAWLTEAFQQLPEALAEFTPSVEALRKRALIETGYYWQIIHEAESHCDALDFAGRLKADDDLSMVVIRGCVVVKRTAMSQSTAVMDPDTFERSRRAVLEWVSAQIGITPDELLANTEKAA